MTDADLVSRANDFWFGPSDAPDFGQRRDHWFKSTPEFDAKIRDGFLADMGRAANGELDDVTDTPQGSLAVIILLDQFPRNVYRGTPQAFATDPKALQLSKQALENGFDEGLLQNQKLFIYLPLEHSEVLADQDQSVDLFAVLGDKHLTEYAIRHRDIVARFGRFPHRNDILGRLSTAEETKFLTQPNSSF